MGNRTSTAIELLGESQQAAEALRRNCETFFSLLRSSPFGIYVVDSAFKLNQASAGARKLFTNVRPFLNRDFNEVLHFLWPEPFATRMQRHFRHTLDTGEPYVARNCTERRRDIDEIESYDWRLERIMLPDDHYGVVCYFYDTTEQQRAVAHAVFLSQLSHKLATVKDVTEINEITTREVGEFLRAFRSFFFEVSSDTNQITLLPYWKRDGADIADVYQMATLGTPEWRATIAQRPLAIDDVRTDSWTKEFATSYQAIDVKAYAIVPFFREGRWVASFGVSSDTPRKWKPEELALLENIAARVWPLIERARSETALRQSEERLQLALDAASVGTYICYVQQDCTEPDQQMLALLGLPPGVTCKHMLLDTIHPEDVPRYAEAVARASDPQGSRLLKEDIRIRWPDGTVRWIAITGKVHFEGDPPVATRMAGAAVDITERKKADTALRESEDLFRTLGDNIAQLAWMTDPAGNVFWFNKRWYEYTGTTEEDIRDQKWEKVHDPQEYKRVKSKWQSALAAGEPWEDIFPLRRRDGYYRWFLSRAVPIREATGKITRWFGTNTDITELRDTQQALAKSETRYRTLFNSIDEGFCIVEVLFDKDQKAVDYRFLEANAAYEKQTGLREVKGKRMRELLPKHEDYWFETYGRVALTREPTRFEKRAEALGQWFDVYAFPIDAPECRRVAILSKEITQLKQNQQILERTVAERTAKLRETVGELEAFSYSIAHDMRAPLRALQGFGRFLSDEYSDKLGATGQLYLSRITSSADRMDQLIKDVLDYSKVVRGSFPMEPVDLKPLLLGIIDSYPSLHPEHATILFEGDFPEVFAHKASLTQCFSNLLGNAVKFVDPGVRPIVHVSAEVIGRFVRVFIKDNGIGIPADQHERIFAIFQRGSPDYEGTGIGLAIVKKAVERMGGKVGVDSELGKGSTFWVELQRSER